MKSILFIGLFFCSFAFASDLEGFSKIKARLKYPFQHALYSKVSHTVEISRLKDIAELVPLVNNEFSAQIFSIYLNEKIPSHQLLLAATHIHTPEQFAFFKKTFPHRFYNEFKNMPVLSRLHTPQDFEVMEIVLQKKPGEYEKNYEAFVDVYDDFNNDDITLFRKLIFTLHFPTESAARLVKILKANPSPVWDFILNDQKYQNWLATYIGHTQLVKLANEPAKMLAKLHSLMPKLNSASLATLSTIDLFLKLGIYDFDVISSARNVFSKDSFELVESLLKNSSHSILKSTKELAEAVHYLSLADSPKVRAYRILFSLKPDFSLKDIKRVFAIKEEYEVHVFKLEIDLGPNFNVTDSIQSEAAYKAFFILRNCRFENIEEFKNALSNIKTEKQYQNIQALEKQWKITSYPSLRFVSILEKFDQPLLTTTIETYKKKNPLFSGAKKREESKKTLLKAVKEYGPGEETHLLALLKYNFIYEDFADELKNSYVEILKSSPLLRLESLKIAFKKLTWPEKHFQTGSVARKDFLITAFQRLYIAPHDAHSLDEITKLTPVESSHLVSTYRINSSMSFRLMETEPSILNFLTQLEAIPEAQDIFNTQTALREKFKCERALTEVQE